jgi:hypothetical protein
MNRPFAAGLSTALLFGALACAGTGLPKEDVGAAPDTTEAQNPEGYRGMEQDTTQVSPDSQPSPSDTFLQEQGTGTPTDTAGYSGMEHPDTTGGAAQDTSGMGGSDTTGMTGVDTTTGAGMDTTTGAAEMDTTGQQ